MSDTFDQLTATTVESQEQAVRLIEKLFTVAQPGGVFGEPTTVEGRTIITASEVNVGMGVGFGFGGGMTPSEPTEEKAKSRRHQVRGGDPHERVELEESEGAEEEDVVEGTPQDTGMGGGGGGGGAASGRPVAVISISEDGVQVEPVVDATKIALAFFTTLGSMFFMLTKMRKAARG